MLADGGEKWRWMEDGGGRRLAEEDGGRREEDGIQDGSDARAATAASWACDTMSSSSAAEALPSSADWASALSAQQATCPRSMGTEAVRDERLGGREEEE